MTLIPTVSINLVSILSEHRWREALRDYWPIPTFTTVGSFIRTRFLLALVMIAYLVSDHLYRGEKVVRVRRKVDTETCR